MGRGFLAATVAVVVICAAVLGSIDSIARGPAPVCGPAKGQTVLEGRRARIYSLPGFEPPLTERVLACLRSGGVRKLSPRGWKTRITEPLLLRAPWAGGVLRHQGVDTYRLTVLALNVRTGSATECPAGGGSHVGGRSGTLLSWMVLSTRGSLAWTAYGYGRKTTVSREVASCTTTGTQVLDSGEGIDLHSLKLNGSTLTWTNGGERQSATLP